MKTYVYFIFLLLFLVGVGSCRSHRSLSEISERNTDIHINEQSTSNTTIKETTHSHVDKTTESNTQENAESVSETSENKQVDEFEETKEVKEEFDENGNLTSRTTTETSRKRLERSDSRAGTHDASSRSESSLDNEQSQESSETDITQENESKSELALQENENTNVNEDTSSDSRLFQADNLIIVGLIVAILILGIYRFRQDIKAHRNGRKKSNPDRSN